jgi:hypothetical protein
MCNTSMRIAALLISFGHPACDGSSSALGDGTGGGGTVGVEAVGNVGGTDNSALFDDSTVIDLKLTFTDSEWARLMYIHSHPPASNTDPKEYVHCGFTFQGYTFPDAACRPKGSPELWFEEPKPQFAIRFDYWNSKGRFQGLRRINLEANQYHYAPVRDRLGMWLMRQAGLHTPRVNHARVLVNGCYFGLYMNIEQIDKEFLNAHFADPSGNLYSQGRELETNKKTNDISRLQALWDLVSAEPLSANHTTFYTNLEGLLDVHTMLLQTAAEVALPTSDNFSNGSSNFYYYDDPQTGRFILLPWDLDSFLDELSPPDANIYEFWGVPGNMSPPNKMLQLAYQKPEWKKEFEDSLVKLRNGPYTALSEQVTSVCNQIRPYVAAEPHPVGTVQQMDEDCLSIKTGIATRTAYIKTVLGR